MENMITRIAILCLACSVVACATRPVSNAAAEDVPGERLLSTQFSLPAPGTGKVTVKRDSGFGGAACTSRIFLNAKPIADLKPAEKVVMYLPTGDHILSAWPNGACGGGMTEVRAAVKDGAEMNFRVGYGSNGDYSINVTAF
jgi:hypothetical protein